MTAPYPLITVCDRDGVETRSVHCAESTKTYRIRFERRPEARVPKDILLECLVRSQQGENVLIICNVVDYAQETFRRLKRLMSGKRIDTVLTHARYRCRERIRRDRIVVEWFGPRGTKKGTIVISTQVIEQSLDIDFDFLVTQICPIDLLLQRLARLHRFDKGARPAPECVVVTPPYVDAKDAVPEMFLKHSYIYQDASVLWRTVEICRNTPKIRLPDDYRLLIDRVETEKRWSNEPDAIWEAHIRALGYQQNSIQKAQWRSSLTVQYAMTRGCPDDLLTREGAFYVEAVPVVVKTAKRQHFVFGGRRPIETMPDSDFEDLMDQHEMPIPPWWVEKRNLPFADESVSRGRKLLIMKRKKGYWYCFDGKGYMLKYTKTIGLERVKI